MARKDRTICRAGLVRHDFDAVEQIAQPRLRHLALLVQQIALGDHQQPEIGGQGAHGLFHFRQQIDRVTQHVAPGVHQFADHRGGHFFIGHLDRGFDHRQ